MAVLEVMTYGAPVLRKEAEEVTEVNDEIKLLIKDLEDTLAQQDGIGLAAPQVGVPKKLCFIDLTKAKGERKIVLLNPKIIYQSHEETIYEEGCLSVPGVWGNVSRPKTVKVKGILPSGKSLIIEADDMFARVLQHEMDHLEGKLFIDYISKEDRDKNLEKIHAIIEQSRKKLGKVNL